MKSLLLLLLAAGLVGCAGPQTSDPCVVYECRVEPPQQPLPSANQAQKKEAAAAIKKRLKAIRKNTE